MKLPKFKCTCPDFQGKVDPTTVWNADRAAWNGMQSRNLYCWHIISAIIAAGLADAYQIPTDMPVPPDESFNFPKRARMQKNPKFGDRF